MEKPVKITSVQHFYHIIASSEQMREFFIALNGGRSWKTIGFSEQVDKNGEPKLEIYNGISGSRQVLTRESLEKKSLVGKAICDGHFYLYDDYDEAPREERMEQQSLEVAIFPKINKQWLIENTDAVQKFIDAKSKELNGIVFTAEDVLVHEESLLLALGELWAQEYSFYLPASIRKAECESAEPGKLMLRVWLAENHTMEEVRQYMTSLNTEKLAQTITDIVLPRLDIQKYLFLTQEKLARAIEHAREHALQPKRKVKEEKDQLSLF